MAVQNYIWSKDAKWNNEFKNIPDNEVISKYEEYVFNSYIKKPYNLSTFTEKVRKVLFFFLIALCISCAPKPTDLSKALVTADNIYNELSPQVEAALESDQSDNERKKSLILIQSKLKDYKISYNQLNESLLIWNETNTPPEKTREQYEEMKKALSDAVNIAFKVNLYISECSGRTTLKGKTGNCL